MMLREVSKLPFVVLDVTRGLFVTCGRIGMLPEVCLATSGCVGMLPEACCLPAVFLGCCYRGHLVTIGFVSVVATNPVFLFPPSPGKMSVGFGERGLPSQLVVSLMPY
jgi:hypothetical protein